MENKPKLFIAACIWLSIIAVSVLTYKYLVAPKIDKNRHDQAVADHQATIEKTGSQSKYTSSVVFAADGFSGYALLRSQTFKDECSNYGIYIDYKDDGANYTQRLKDLSDGKVDMAVFTYDALIKNSADLNDFPATIVGLIDESKGADAIIGAGKKYPNIDSMNNSETKIVCVQNSPSETLARVIMAHFNLDKLSENPFEFVDSMDSVYKKYQQAKPTDNRVFVLWEPYVTKILDNPDYHILVDSSKFRGYIVDVIVAKRGFLIKNNNIVENVIKSYLTTSFKNKSNMIDVVMSDAKSLGEPLKKEQAERLTKSIWWKNTQETFGHFGMNKGTGLQSMEDMGRNITDVLLRTKSINKDPTSGKYGMWYYDGIIKNLFDNSWHPGFGSESVREEIKLNTLKDEEWSQLKPVGTLQVPRLVFSRGTDKISVASESTLIDLSEKLKVWPQYYLIVQGHASSDGDVSANLALANRRAKATVEWLSAHGVDKNRIKAETAKQNGSTTVAFVVGEIPY